MASPKRHPAAAPSPARPAGAEDATAAAAINPADQLDQLKLKMQATRAKLLRVKPDKLSDADHDAWSEQIVLTNLAITRLRNAKLENLSNEFKRELPAFESSASKLADELAKFTQSVDIIKAVAGALGVITKIATLLG
jgi:hypothetical protein